MPTHLHRTLICLSILFAGATSAFAQPRVVATIAPLHSLVALVMEGAGVPQLLLKGTESPHSYSLRPSQTRMLSSADVVIRIDASFEVFMNKPLRALAGRALVIDLLKVPGMKLLSVQDDHDHHGHSHHGHAAATDPHIWLSTGNAIAILDAVAAVLANEDPGNAVLYRGNAARASIRLRALKSELDGTLKTARSRPFVTFHDAWQYFVAEFGMVSAGALTINPERKPGARRLAKVRDIVRNSGARCLFAEPQFPPALARVVVRGTPAKIGVIDPVGANLTPGSDLYFRLMRQTAQKMTACLGSSGG